MKTLLKSVLKWCLIVGFFPFSLLYLLSLKKRREYEETAYFSATQIPYNCIRRRAGVRGEYLLYKELCFLEEIGAKFLFNAYNFLIGNILRRRYSVYLFKKMSKIIF